jgi:hypothetical protein
MSDINEFIKQNGGSVLNMDEALALQKEFREGDIIFWGKVYMMEDFVELPDDGLTSEATYRKWCLKVSGFSPEKRTPTEFSKYVRPIIFAAPPREIMPGCEYGAEVDAAIEDALSSHIRTIKNINNGWEYVSGTMAWVETLDESRGPEIIIKIKTLMSKINQFESAGHTEGKIKRRDVGKRLLYYGRGIADRGGSVNRLRSAYALSIVYLEGGFEAVMEEKARVESK